MLWIMLNKQKNNNNFDLFQNTRNKQQCFQIIKLFFTKIISNFHCNQIFTNIAPISERYAKIQQLGTVS